VEQIRWLTGVSNEGVEAIAFERSIGLMIQPDNGTRKRLGRYPFWAADNGVFTTKKRGFSPRLFRRMIARPELQEHAARCLFVVAPDVLYDAHGTLERFPEWATEIRALGFRVALVAQNGLETMLDEVPWDLVDVLFIGGDDEWKLGPHAARCVAEARARGKRTHMGRVNSLERLELASAMMCDTADGTFLRFGPVKNLPRVEKWHDELRCGGVQIGLPHT